MKRRGNLYSFSPSKDRIFTNFRVVGNATLTIQQDQLNDLSFFTEEVWDSCWMAVVR